MTTPESPVTPGNDAVLREWVRDISEAADMDCEYSASEPGFPRAEKLLRRLCEAVAAAERERCAVLAESKNPGPHESVPGDNGWVNACTQRLAVNIRSLRGLPEIGRPR